MKLAVFGLGKLGAPLAAVLAHKGHQVVGVDVNPPGALLAPSITHDLPQLTRPRPDHKTLSSGVGR